MIFCWLGCDINHFSDFKFNVNVSLTAYPQVAVATYSPGVLVDAIKVPAIFLKIM